MHQGLEVGLDPCQRIGSQHRAQLGAQAAQNGGVVFEAGAFEHLDGGLDLRQLLRREMDKAAQGIGSQPPVPPGVRGVHYLQWPEHRLDGVAQPLGRPAADREFRADVVEGEPRERPLKANGQAHDVPQAFVSHRAVLHTVILVRR